MRKLLSAYIKEEEQKQFIRNNQEIETIRKCLDESYSLTFKNEAILEAYNLIAEDYSPQELKSELIQEAVRANTIALLKEASGDYSIDQFYEELAKKAKADGFDDINIANAFNEALVEFGVDPALTDMPMGKMREVETAFWQTAKEMQAIQGDENASDLVFNDNQENIEDEIPGIEENTLEQEEGAEGSIDPNEVPVNESATACCGVAGCQGTGATDFNSVREATMAAFGKLIPRSQVEAVIDDEIMPMAAEMSEQEFTAEIQKKYPGIDLAGLGNIFNMLQAAAGPTDGLEDEEVVTEIVAEDPPETEEIIVAPMSGVVLESYDIFKAKWKHQQQLDEGKVLDFVKDKIVPAGIGLAGAAATAGVVHDISSLKNNQNKWANTEVTQDYQQVDNEDLNRTLPTSEYKTTENMDIYNHAVFTLKNKNGISAKALVKNINDGKYTDIDSMLTGLKRGLESYKKDIKSYLDAQKKQGAKYDATGSIEDEAQYFVDGASKKLEQVATVGVEKMLTNAGKKVTANEVRAILAKHGIEKPIAVW